MRTATSRVFLKKRINKSTNRCELTVRVCGVKIFDTDIIACACTVKMFSKRKRSIIIFLIKQKRHWNQLESISKYKFTVRACAVKK